MIYLRKEYFYSKESEVRFLLFYPWPTLNLLQVVYNRMYRATDIHNGVTNTMVSDSNLSLIIDRQQDSKDLI